MKLEEYIFTSIEAFERGERDHALLNACIAIDITSQKRANRSQSSRSIYIETIRNYYWILEPMMGSGINFDETFFENVQLKSNKGVPVEKIDIAAFVYYMFRCNQVHGKEIPPRFTLITVPPGTPASYLISYDKLHLPENIIWALLSICVFAKTNLNVKSNKPHYLSLGSNRFAISDWWGLEDYFRPIAAKLNPIRVAWKGLNFSEQAREEICRS
jgi:hypothetical protein